MKGTTITVVGNLITPVNRRNLGDGRSVANFRVACNERRIDRTTGAWGDGDTFYIGVSCWRELAENVAATFGVGDPIIVRGRIYTNSYDGKDGGRRTVQEIDADAVGPDLSRCRVSALTRTKRGTGPATADVVTEPDADGPDREDVDRDDFGAEELERAEWSAREAMQDPRFVDPEDDGAGPELAERREAVPVGGH